MATPNLLVLAADRPDAVLDHLTSRPDLASMQDETGYSLLHAAASYSHGPLLRALVQTFNVSPNISDEDEETPLFVVETVEIAKILVEELGADWKIQNEDGTTAGDKFASEGEFPEVAAYLTGLERLGPHGEHQHPPRVPDGLEVDLRTVEAPGAASGDATDAVPGEEVVDPILRERIEALAARPDFQSEDGQQALRELVQDALRGHVLESDRDVRQRMD
jgi:uncharacterized protein